MYSSIEKRIHQRIPNRACFTKVLFQHDLQQNGEIQVQQIRSNDNLADLFTKALPTSMFEKLR